MEGFFARFVAILAWTGLCAAAGGYAGHWIGMPVLMAATAAVAGATAATLLDRWRGQRLLQWLKSSLQPPAPRDAGFWGEMAYRIERVLLQRDRELQAEREGHEQFLSAIEASPNGVMLLDAGQQIQWLNKTAADHFGLDPVRDLRQRVTNLVRAPAFVSYLQSGFSAGLAGGAEPTVTFAAPRSGITLSVMARSYGKGQGLVLSQDVTERERAEAMRRDFVANVSHEIRTPLTVLAGFVENLGSLPLEEPERRRVLALMEQQTARMQALVADLLTLAQLEGSPRPPTDQWVAVSALLTRVQADAIALSAGRHEWRVSAGEEAEIAGLSEELHSALSNLVTNAVRYTPAGGRIELRWLHRDDGSAAFEVSDNGPGIAREHIPRLTERFYRVDSGRSRDSGGTGLGLAIVKHVMQRHGGQVEIESEPGRGSTFRLVLPALRVRRAAPPAARDAAGPGAQGHNPLHVRDRIDHRSAS